MNPTTRTTHLTQFLLASHVLLLAASTTSLLAPAHAQTGTPVWNRRSPANRPPPMTSAKTVYDTARGVTVLFGGVLNNNVNTLNDNTWEYDGLDWKQVSVATKPPGRYGAYLAYDSVRRVTVLFGGMTGASSYTGDTWEYNGSNWTVITTSTAPPPRSFGNMVFDQTTLKVVLHGGMAAVRTNDTWEYDGFAKTWTQIMPTTSAPQSGQFAMTYDVLRSRAIVFAGVDTAFALTNSLWEYDGTAKNWSQPAITGAVPRTRRLVSAAYSLTRQVMVIHGGDVFPGHLADTWEYDGLTRTWTDRTVAGSGPGNDQQYGFAYDLGRDSIVLWGGYTGATPTTFTTTDWTWRYGPRGAFRPFGSGCQGSTAVGTPSLVARSSGPVIGQSHDLRIAPVPTTAFLILGLSNQRLQNLGPMLPLDLGFVGAPGCALHVSTEIVLPLTGSGGFADVSIPVPASLGLTGFRYYHQALVRDPAGNTLQHVLTNAGEATIL